MTVRLGSADVPVLRAVAGLGWPGRADVTAPGLGWPEDAVPTTDPSPTDLQEPS